MIILDNQPRLADIEALVRKVPHFPYSVKQLLGLARGGHFSEEIINFFKTFPKDEIFEDADDLIARVEQIEMMHEEESGQPIEQWGVPQED